MSFESFAHAQSFLLWAGFILAVILGAVANRTGFCTMGAVSDWVNMGDLGRMRSWMLAVAVALAGVVALEAAGLVHPAASFPPYRSGQLAWAENLLGGLLFGVGMTLASGCGNKTLVRMGAGNLKSVVVFLVMGAVAYFMLYPFPGTDRTLYSLLFHPWTRPLTLTVGAAQDLGSLAAGADKAGQVRTVLGLAIAAALLAYVLRCAEFRGNRDQSVGGVVVGLCVVAAWLLTSVVAVRADNESHSLRGFVEQWEFYAPADAVRPADARTLGPQSLTFVSPMGQAVGYAASRFDGALLTFGIVVIAGVVAGSLAAALASRSFRIEWFADGRDFANHVLGAVLMGAGGVLAMGCTFGQGITGLSTLSLGSFITVFAIVAGSAATMKYQYWRLMREG